MQSILQDRKYCYLTGSTEQLNRHEIFFGQKNRQVSLDNGFWVWLRWDRHIADSPLPTPHNNREVDLMLKRECQAKYEETHSRESFLKLIGRNYLEV